MKKTKDGVRYFVCKRCGLTNAENVYSWRKKRQVDKNVCLLCLEKRERDKVIRRERAYDNYPYHI